MNVYYACIARNASKGGWVEDVDLIMAALMLHGFIQMRGAELYVSVLAPLALHVPHVSHVTHPCTTPVRYLSHPCAGCSGESCSGESCSGAGTVTNLYMPPGAHL